MTVSKNTSVSSVSSVVEILCVIARTAPSPAPQPPHAFRLREIAGGRRRCPQHPAESSILGGFHGTAHGFAYERRHFDSALLDVENDGSCGGSFVWLQRPRVWRLPGAPGFRPGGR